MEVRRFMTRVKGDHKLGGIDYVLGKISGLMSAICNPDRKTEFANGQFKNGDVIMTTIATEEQYETFKSYVEDRYPGLCEFDYDFTK